MLLDGRVFYLPMKSPPVVLPEFRHSSFSGLNPVAISYFTLNALLLIAAIRILGIQFCIRTIFSVIVMTLLLSFFGMYNKRTALLPENPFMSCIIGGILCGAGIGIVFTLTAAPEEQILLPP